MKRWFPLTDAEKRFAVERAGIAESDIRDGRRVENRFVVIMRLWNHRKVGLNEDAVHGHSLT